MNGRVWGVVVAGFVLLGVLVVVDAGPVAAQGGEFELPEGVTWDEVNSVASKMYCDVCEGIPLDECESVACRNWRREIARLLGEGQSEDEIIDYFVERYGADVAALPRSTGDRLLAFAIPFAIVVLVGVIGAFQVRSLRQRGHQRGDPVRRSGAAPTERPVPDDINPHVLERLLRELKGVES